MVHPLLMSAGYSKKSLTEKLGLNANQRIAILQAPPYYLRGLKPPVPGKSIFHRLVPRLDFIQFFTTSRQELETTFPALKESLLDTGALWISWPKKAARSSEARQKAAKVVSDLDENIIRDLGLAAGLVDVKVVAIDEVWSGLKFVVRLKDRA